jgi:hypothetical protein
LFTNNKSETKPRKSESFSAIIGSSHVFNDSKIRDKFTDDICSVESSYNLAPGLKRLVPHFNLYSLNDKLLLLLYYNFYTNKKLWEII